MAFQETWFQDDDELEIEGFTWFGRNRSTERTAEDAPHGSAGVGWLIWNGLLKGAKVKSMRPTYGECEGLLIVTIKKDGHELVLIYGTRPLGLGFQSRLGGLCVWCARRILRISRPS